jgi:uncharacterized protein
MHKASLKLGTLEDRLLHMPEDTMVLSQLDGFLTGVILCPDSIMPSEWLPLVWGPSDEGDGALFASMDDARKVTGLILDHYNMRVRQLEDPACLIDPCFDDGGSLGIYDTVWEMWVDGFAEAQYLGAFGWMRMLKQGDKAAGAAFAAMLMLQGLSDGESEDISREDQKTMLEGAPEAIPVFVQMLNEWRLKQRRPLSASLGTAHSKLGRNAACRCGSRKKFKKCCGAA